MLTYGRRIPLPELDMRIEVSLDDLSYDNDDINDDDDIDIGNDCAIDGWW